MIKKYLRLTVLLAVLLCGVSACQRAEDEIEEPVQAAVLDDETTLVAEDGCEEASPTGYSDSGIQQAFIYYDDQLFMLEHNEGIYQADEFEDRIESLNLVSLGSTVDELNHQWPSKDLEASRISVGSPVYFNEENRIVYVLFDGEALYQFRPYNGELYELDAD